jgi:hypothetical protein
MDGAFTLLAFPDDQPELLYLDYVTGALHIEEESEVREARLKAVKLSGYVARQGSAGVRMSMLTVAL